MRHWAQPFIVLSLAGPAVSACCHVAALLGASFGSGIFLLLIGLAVAWIPTLYVQAQLEPDISSRLRLFDVLFDDCPGWTRCPVLGHFVYMLLMFCIGGGSGRVTNHIFGARVFTSSAMAGYAISAASLKAYFDAEMV
ncbi:MAG TPA: hypothetical protein VGM37_11985 [Armatimonadota bacterium]|jgi:hypothetical protein